MIVNEMCGGSRVGRLVMWRLHRSAKRLAAILVRAADVGGCVFVMGGLFFLAALSAGRAADVVLLRGKRPYAIEEESIRTAARFYGLELQTVEAGSGSTTNGIMPLLRSHDTVAVVMSQETLSALDRTVVRAALRRPGRVGVPTLVFGVSVLENPEQLRSWSGDVVQACRALPEGFRPVTLEFGRTDLGRTMSGMALPAVGSPVCKLQFEPRPAVETVLAAQGNGGSTPVLVRYRAKGGELFFLPQLRIFDQSWVGTPGGLQKAFSSIAPFMLFLRYAAGSYGWQLNGHYANLTIDDAWLTQPYGHLDYPALLSEMQRHNFHTTIAFIPWNFDRSEPTLVALFRLHPGRFSICVHGNDHEHREFGDYALNPLREQIADIRQGVARMERFHALTGIPYDRFMVFPHGVAPEATFAALKRYEFLGTANAVHVPLGTGYPTDPVFLLRPYTTAYADLLSLSRYPAGDQVPQQEIALQAFLNNPLLFYAHESLFDRGIGAFNGFADAVNQIQPDTRWASLGEIARHIHLGRKRHDGGSDVRMLSNELVLTNTTDKEAVYYVEREEHPGPPIATMTVNDRSADAARVGDRLTLRLVIPARQSRQLRVRYANDLDPSREDIRRTNLHAYALRRISDFRDLFLATSPWGHSIARAYYRYGVDSIQRSLERKWWVGVTGLGFVCVGIIYRRRRHRTRPAQSPPANRAAQG